MRATISEGDSKSLACANNHVGTPFSRRGQKGKAQQVSSNSNCDLFFMRLLYKCRIIPGLSELIRILYQCTKQPTDKFNTTFLACDDLYTKRHGPGFDYFQRLGKQAFRYKKFIDTTLNSSTAPGIVEHDHGFSCRSAFIEQ